MSVDSISLTAQAAYSKVLNQPTLSAAESIKQSQDFQDIVRVEFNRFASMSPEQIMHHLKGNGVSGVIPVQTGSVLSSSIHSLSDVVRKQDKTIRDSLIGEASMLDVLNATSEAKNTVQTITALRDKLFAAFEKVMSMQI